MKSKKAQIDLEIFESPAFWILTAIGYAAFFFMLMILKGMEQSELMPMWVKIVVIIFIPIMGAAFSMMFGE